MLKSPIPAIFSYIYGIIKLVNNIEIIVATHKKYAFPKGKDYVPLHVGAKLSKEDLKIARDDTGDNISEKNPSFCELTGFYWLTKNSKADFLGLVHYRRLFTLKSGRIKPEDSIDSALSDKEIDELVKNYDLILPKPRNYHIETLWSHYEHTLHIAPLKKTREIIKKSYPEYLKEFDRLKTRKTAHMFNMLIGKRELITEYSDWLFKVLFELEKELEKSKEAKKYDSFHSRFYGRISELLLDVWLYTKHPNLKIKELRVVDVEGVNWFKKGTSFLLAKFGGKKYGKSF